MNKMLIALSLTLLSTIILSAQVEGPARTEALVSVVSKAEELPPLSDIRLKVNGQDERLIGWSPVTESGAQVAILIDEGLRQTIGTELRSLSSFVNELPEGTQVAVGYMRNGTVFMASSFTTDHAAAASSFRLPLGSPGISASPYFCLSEFVKHWPTDQSVPGARFVLMITNGVDPYNGSTSLQNQNSPYVQSAIQDAQRAGVSVSSIYFGDAGYRGAMSSFSGQGYLNQVAEETGGQAYYQGVGNPISLAPFLGQFRKMLSETYVASFMSLGSTRKLQRIQMQTSRHDVKLRAPQYVQAGNREASKAD